MPFGYIYARRVHRKKKKIRVFRVPKGHKYIPWLKIRFQGLSRLKTECNKRNLFF